MKWFKIVINGSVAVLCFFMAAFCAFHNMPLWGAINLFIGSLNGYVAYTGIIAV